MGSNLSTLGREGYRRNTGFGRKIVETSVIYAKIEAPASSPISSPSSTQAEAPESTQGRVNQYHIYREIGSGAYGRVMLCRSEEDSRFYACKIISKLRLRKKFRWQGGGLGGCSTPGGTVQQDAALATVRQEIAILKKISKHNNINGLVEVLDDQKEDNLYLIFDLCEYGPIMHMAVNSRVRPFAENLARELFRDVVLGLEYLHFLKIIHRDLKPENLLLRADMTLQISDFGISYMCMDSGGGDDEEDVVLDQKNASPLFTSPEACMPETREISGKAVDIWSLGVTLFCFVHGYCPWEDDNVLQLYGKIVNDPPVISSHYCSKDLQDLLTQMLQKDPGARITLKEIRDHPWVTKSGDLPMMTTEENCQFDPVTEEEIENAVNPSVTFVTKIMNKLRGKRNSNGQVLSESQGRLPQKQKSFHHSTPVMSQRGGTLGRNGLLPSGAHFSNSSIQISPSVESLTSANGNSTGGFGSLWKRRAKSYNPGGSGSGAGSAGCGSLPSSRPITPLPVLPPPLAIPPVTTQPSIPLLVPMSPKSSGGRENAGMPYLRGMSSFSTSSRRLGEIQPVVTERNGSEYGTPKRTDSQRDNRMGLEDGGHMVPEPAQDRENGGGQRSGSLISLP
ncbi:kinase-like domain-containing protein [Polychytrium aggregatum]|uniref:kinase-like domain-containing protein n=1 Tax=Polychytrium aggregatum TaxID=110093 RepID=UPI0022FE5B31|nr:kinase-like domain-containing protein [Polychytrium aggregatum]KAI9197187.1 kinase-like domain-containing protein [Polychytrium aggregatum]